MKNTDKVVTGEFDAIRETGQRVSKGVTVVVPLYNDPEVICETLDSVLAQSFRPLSLIAIDDCSADNSLDTAQTWFRAKAEGFAWAALLKHRRNYGLSTSRNTGFATAATDLVFALDADNHLYPQAVELCAAGLAHSDAAFAYPILEVFGTKRGLMGTEVWSKERLKRGNYIDAMALIRKARWQQVGGYFVAENPQGWEDFDLWCKFAEQDWHGLRIPQILGRYRAKKFSMMRETDKKIDIVISRTERRHPWLRLDPINIAPDNER